MSALIDTQKYVPDWQDRPWRMLVEGRWIDATEQFNILDPGTETTIASVPKASLADTDTAVAAARRSFDAKTWCAQPASHRAQTLWRIADIINMRADELSLIEARNQGGPYNNLRNHSIPEAAHVFRYYAGWVDKIAGRAMELSRGTSNFHAYTLQRPVGVVGLITPWNSPLLMAAWKVAPALAAGCSCILKPAELTPLTSLLLGEIVQEAGVPDGVLNIVTGDGPIVGAHLAEHPQVDKVAFTGSTSAGRAIIHSAAGNLKKVSLELGGKSPVIVFDDADLDKASAGATTAIFSNAGQVCTAGSRVIVHEDIYDTFTAEMAKRAQALKVGYSFDPQSEMGPLISAKQRDTVLGYVESGVSEGATLLTGGQAFGPGFFIQPTVLGNTQRNMRVVREEIFGPVVAAMRFSTTAEAVALANDSSYGLAASVWTNSVKTAHNVASKLRVGRIGLNIHGIPDVTMPTGGFKESGWGRELGPEGLDLFLETTSVFTNIN